MTFLTENAKHWDAVFREAPDRTRFVRKFINHTGADVLDVGCATGSLSVLLGQSGANVVGIDINPRFVDAARVKNPRGKYFVADMRDFRLSKKFDLIICLGTTFSHNLILLSGCRSDVDQFSETPKTWRVSRRRRDQRDRIYRTASVSEFRTRTPVCTERLFRHRNNPSQIRIQGPNHDRASLPGK